MGMHETDNSARHAKSFHACAKASGNAASLFAVAKASVNGWTHGAHKRPQR